MIRKRILTIAWISCLWQLTGCGTATGPGPLTDEQQRQGEAEMKLVEDEERGTPITRGAKK